MATLGMRNTTGSNMFLLSIYQYSYAYELEQSSYVMNLACRTLCLITHTTYMISPTPKLRWWFVVPSGLPVSYACQSVGSKSWGIWVVPLYMGMVLGYMGAFGCDGAPRLRGRRLVVIALSVLYNPLRSGIRIGVHKLPHEVGGRPVLDGLPVRLMLRSRS